MILKPLRKPGPAVHGERFDENEELPPLTRYVTRQPIVRVSKWIIRRLGHSMPRGAWLETMNWPGIVLTARCRYCERIFTISGNPMVGTGQYKPAPQYTLDRAPGYVASYEIGTWGLSEKILHRDDDFETSKAFSWKKEKNQNQFLNDRITDVGPMDWRPDILNEESEDQESLEKKIIQSKLEKIAKRFYCKKVQTWL